MKAGWYGKLILLILLSFSFVTIFLYLSIRIIIFITLDFPWYEKLLASVLLLAELFVLIQSTGYFINIFYVLLHSLKKTDPPPIIFDTYPPVAVIVPSYKEPLEIIQNTLICTYNLSYPNKRIYLLDDTRYDLPWDTDENKEKYRKAVDELCRWVGVSLFRANWHGAKAGIINDFMQFLDGNFLPGFEFIPAEKYESKEIEKYIAVFDSDMNPIPEFLEEPVFIMEKNPKIAFVQTPQYYTNFETNRIARVAGLQQAIFYEYICEGKGLQGAMFCCGTNVLLRREALKDVGGFDEESVTEDFATSLKMHIKGWESVYLNRVAAFGMGPQDLAGFFKQQFRWARGNLGILKGLPLKMWSSLHKMPLNIWWEYWLACTHYLVGWVFLVMVLFPVMYLFFNVPSYFADPVLYFFSFVPYIIFSFAVFFLTLKVKRYRAIDMLSTTLINAVTFPIYIKASINALLGIKVTFGITPKDGSTILPLRALFPQILLNLMCFAAVIWGLLRIYYERDPVYALAVNVFWCFYNFTLIGFFLHFNHSEESTT